VARRKRLRFGRAALAQVDAEHDEYGDRQELALPVLEALVPELRVAERVEIGVDRRRVPRRVLPTTCSQNDSASSAIRAALSECA
jgi:hypothetical protein